ncbi:hypothetical protein BJ997_001660 [Cryobacterium roopkundense]|uniref:Uncharacterized protein n=1 Tax=Cryobacterium roopkundense TaxID=1001240 RepID=A0A7W8ZVV5_9MICO|nr:hypothetical protein [Cryobacterium roopkundense]
MRRDERRLQLENVVNAVVTNANRNGKRYHSDSEVENRARANRGMPRVSINVLIVQLAFQDATERMPTNMLTADDARNAARVPARNISPSSRGPQTAVEGHNNRPLFR